MRESRLAGCAGVTLVLTSIGAAIGVLPPLIALLTATCAWLVAIVARRGASRWLILVVAAVARVALVAAPYASDDLHRFVWEGRVCLAGENPYELAPDAPELESLRGPRHGQINHPDHASIYPPGALAVFTATAALGFEERELRALFAAVDMGVVVALLSALRRRRLGPGAALIYAWSPIAAVGAASGHFEPLMHLPLVCVLVLQARRRYLAAGVLLGIATSVKVVPVLLLPWLLVRAALDNTTRARSGGVVGRLRARRSLVLALLGFAAIVAPLAFTFSGVDLARPLRSFATKFEFNAALFGLLRSVSPESAHTLAAFLLAVWTLVVAVLQPRGPAAFVWTLGGLLVVSPTVHFWYLTWVLAPAALAAPAYVGPVVAWAAASSALYPTYHTAFNGGPWIAHEPATWLISAALAFGLLVVLLRRTRAKAVQPAAPTYGAAIPGAYSVVIPALREYENLRELVPAWLTTDARHVIIANTPSGDDTPSLAAIDPRVRIVEVSPRGYGSAVARGLQVVQDVDFLVIADADHHLGPAQVRALLAPFEGAPRVTLVTAARDVGSPLSRPQRLGNRLLTTLIAIGWRRRFHDLGPYRALRVADWAPGSLADLGFGVNVEQNVRALMRGAEVVEVALPGSKRKHGLNEISGTWRGVWGAGRGMLWRALLLREEAARECSGQG